MFFPCLSTFYYFISYLFNGGQKFWLLIVRYWAQFSLLSWKVLVSEPAWNTIFNDYKSDQTTSHGRPSKIGQMSATSEGNDTDSLETVEAFDLKNKFMLKLIDNV